MDNMLRRLRRGGSSTSAPSEGGTEEEIDQYGLHEVHDAGPKALVDIIAIHGLNGHWKDTWTNVSTSTFWLEDLLPSQIPDTRIISYGYDADTHGDHPVSKETIDGHARTFISQLVAMRKFTGTTERPIVFIAYSLGGIVLKSALISSHLATSEHLPHHRSLQPSTYGILFIGTPQQGVEKTDFPALALNVASVMVSTNKSYYKYLKRDSLWLQEQATQYLSISMRFQTKCFYEVRATPTKGGHHQHIVPRDSAILPGTVNNEAIGLNKDHLTLVKFKNRGDNDYKQVALALSDFVHDAPGHVVGAWSKEKDISRIGTYVPPFILPFGRDPKFVPRSTLAARMDDFLALSNHPKRLGLYGRSGTGKTAIANQLAHRYKDTYPSNLVFWVHAGSRSRFEADFYEIAKQLNITGYDDPNQNTLRLVKEHLNKPTTAPWLLIIDNADDLAMFKDPESSAGGDDLFQYLPQSRQGRIIVTSQSAKHAAMICDPDDIVEVPAMTPSEALALTRKRLGDNFPCDDSLKELLFKLEYLPQGITQASAWITYNQSNTKEYLRLLETSSAELLAEPYADLRRDRQVPNSIIASAKLSFDQILREHPNAIEIMSLITVVDNQAIPESLLDDAFEYTPFDSAKALGILKAFSLLVLRRDMKTYDMHKLVQISAQAWLKTNESLTKWQETAESLLARCFPTAEFEIWSICSAYLPHADVVLKYSNNGIPTRLNRRASILTKTATFLDQRGFYDRAEPRHRESLAIREQYLGTEDEETVAVVQSLALTLRHAGQYNPAEELCNRALDVRKRLLGDQHPDTASVLSDLGIVLRHLGKWPEAGALHRQALQVREETLGKDDRLTIESVVALSAVLWHQSQNEEAEKLNLWAIEASGKTFGKRHPNTLTAMNNMANTLWNKGLLEKAEILYKEVLLIREDLLGSDHADTLITHSNIAALYWDMKRFEEAEAIQREVLRLRLEVLGQNHTDTITSMNNLAMALRGQKEGENREKKLTEAASLLRDVVDARTALLGEDSPDTLGAINNLALILKDLGHYAEAEYRFRRTIKGLETVVGLNHRNTHTCYLNLAMVLQHMEKFVEGESYLRKCIDGRVQVLGSDHFSTQEAREKLANFKDVERNLICTRIAAFGD